MWAIGEPSGPIENGTTYIVRPFIEPLKRPLELLAHLGRVAPVVGRPGVAPRAREQMKVRSSTRATSPGSERAR